MAVKVRRCIVVGTLCVLGGSVVTMTALPNARATAATVSGCSAPTVRGGVSTVVCSYTGSAAKWTVPSGVVSATFTVYGAQGGSQADSTPPTRNLPGGRGGKVSGTLPVAPGEVLQVRVGGSPPVARPRGGSMGAAPVSDPVVPTPAGAVVAVVPPM